MTAIVTVLVVEKLYGDRRVLRGVSLAVHERDRIGMLGANGAGKSTLLKMMVYGASAGPKNDPTLVPDEGVITWMKGLVLEFVSQEPVLPLDEPVSAAFLFYVLAYNEICT